MGRRCVWGFCGSWTSRLPADRLGAVRAFVLGGVAGSEGRRGRASRRSFERVSPMPAQRPPRSAVAHGALRSRRIARSAGASVRPSHRRVRAPSTDPPIPRPGSPFVYPPGPALEVEGTSVPAFVRAVSPMPAQRPPRSAVAHRALRSRRIARSAGASMRPSHRCVRAPSTDPPIQGVLSRSPIVPITRAYPKGASRLCSGVSGGRRPLLHDGGNGRASALVKLQNRSPGS